MRQLEENKLTHFRNYTICFVGYIWLLVGGITTLAILFLLPSDPHLWASYKYTRIRLEGRSGGRSDEEAKLPNTS